MMKSLKYFFLLLILSICACLEPDSVNDDNTPCSAMYAFGLTLTVYSSNLQPMTNIICLLTDLNDSNYTETLTYFSGGYSGAGERAGEYNLSINEAGYLPYTTNFILTGDVCHVIGISADVYLTASP